MLPENTLAILARNERWADGSATEPYEAGWAKEAVVFVRALHAAGPPGTARVQIAPDGMHWVDEGTVFPLPGAPGASTFARIAHFGNFLRIVAGLAEGASVTVVVSLHLKA